MLRICNLFFVCQVLLVLPCTKKMELHSFWMAIWSVSREIVSFGDVFRWLAFLTCNQFWWSVCYWVAEFHIRKCFLTFCLKIKLLEKESPMYMLLKLHAVCWSFLATIHLRSFFPYLVLVNQTANLCMLIGQHKKSPVTVKLCKVSPFMYVELAGSVAVLHTTNFFENLLTGQRCHQNDGCYFVISKAHVFSSLFTKIFANFRSSEWISINEQQRTSTLRCFSQQTSRLQSSWKIVS